MTGKELWYEDSNGEKRVGWNSVIAGHGKLLEGMSPSHDKVVVMKICWAKTTPVILKSAIKVIKMEESSEEEEVTLKSNVMVERDERVRGVEEQFNGLKDLVHIYRNAVRDRIRCRCWVMSR